MAMGGLSSAASAQKARVPGRITTSPGGYAIAGGPETTFIHAKFRKITPRTVVRLGIYDCTGKYRSRRITDRTGRFDAYYRIKTREIPAQWTYKVSLHKKGLKAVVDRGVWTRVDDGTDPSGC